MKHRIYHQFELIDEGDHVDDGQFTIENLAGDLNKNSITDSDAPVIIKGLTVVPTGPASDHVEVSEGYGAQTDGKPLIHDGVLGTIDVDLSLAADGNICNIEIQYAVEDTENQPRTFIDALGATSTAPVDKLRTAAIAYQYVEGTAVAAPAITAGWVKIAEVVKGAAIAAGDIKNVDAYFSGVDNTGWTADKQATLKIRSLKQHRDIFDHALATVDYTHLNSALKALIDESQYDVVISEQGTGTAADFEYWFGDGSETTPAGGTEIAGGWTYTVVAGITRVEIPEGTRILLLPCTAGGTVTTFNANRAYILKTRVLLQHNVVIRGLNEETTIVTLSRALLGETGFETGATGAVAATTADSTAGSADLTNTGSTVNLYIGQYITFQEPYRLADGIQSSFVVYRIVNIVGNTVTVDRIVHANKVGGWLRIPTVGIVLEGFTVDGQAGIGKSTVAPAYIDDHVFDLRYCAWSTFDVHIVNLHVGDGAGANDNIYKGLDSYYCRVGNIEQCRVEGGNVINNFYFSEIHDISAVETTDPTYAGVVAEFCAGSHIWNVSNCVMGLTSTVSNCHYCVIEYIRGCSNTGAASTGGGVGQCSYSTIRHVHDCTTTLNGGGLHACDYCVIEDVQHCYAPIDGGGVSQCDYCVIDNIYACKANGSGGGAMACLNSTIRNVIGCDAVTNDGGGLHSCDYCLIENVQDCTVNTVNGEGGGMYACDYCSIDTVVDCVANDGGGVHSCLDCTITHVVDCSVTGGGSFGGGLHSCDRCTVTHVSGCTSEDGGGGLYQCDQCVVTNVVGCSDTATGDGGGLAQCNECTIRGVYACVTTAGDGGGLADCDRCSINTVCDCDANGAGKEGGGAHECDECLFSGMWVDNASTGGVSLNFDTCANCVGLVQWGPNAGLAAFDLAARGPWAGF